MNKNGNLYTFFLNRILLPLGDILLGSNYTKNIRIWESYDKLSEEELLKLQKHNLSKILEYASSKVPFYKGIELTNNPSQNLKKFPILTKSILREKSDLLISEDFEKQKLEINYSSGSSGQQSFSYNHPKNKFLAQAIQRHWFHWTNYREGESILQFGISPNRKGIKGIKDFFMKVYYEEAFSLSEKDFERIYTLMKTKKIKFLLGYPSAVYELAKWMNKNYLSLNVSAIMSLGDKLFTHYEKLFKKVFKNPQILDTYGCAEGFMIAARIDIPYYYISSPHVFIEIVDDFGHPVEDGKMGHILVTCLTNYAQPFIRYKLGDLGIKLPKNEYPENRRFNYPLLQKIVGRETDVVKTSDGQKLIVHSFTGVFEYFPEIKQFKITQLSINSVLVEYISDEISEKKLKQIESQLNRLCSNMLKFTFKKVEYILPTMSGKPQIIESKIDK